MMKTLEYICYFITELYIWSELFCWMIGWSLINLLKGNIKGFIEMTYWIRIHLTYRGQSAGKRKLSFKELLIAKLTVFFGFVLINFFLFGIFNILKYIIKLCSY